MDSYFELKEKGLRKVLTLNSIKCLECNTVLESKHQHHFVTCGCKNQTFNDGGLIYNRVGAVDLDKVENLSKYVYMTEQEYEDMLERKRIKDEDGTPFKLEKSPPTIKLLSGCKSKVLTALSKPSPFEPSSNVLKAASNFPCCALMKVLERKETKNSG